MLLIHACVCCVAPFVVQVAMINSTNMTFIQNFTGEQVGLATHPSQHPSQLHFCIICHVRADGLLLWLLSGCRRPEWRRVSLPEVFRISLSLRLNFKTFQDGRCSGGGPPLHGERNGELSQRGGQGVPVPAAVPTHLLRSCSADGDVHLRPLRDGDSSSGRPQPGWIQW